MKIYPNNNLLSSIKYRAAIKNEKNSNSLAVKSNKPTFKGKEFFYNAESLVNSLRHLYGDCDKDNLFAKIISLVSRNKDTIIGNSGSNARFFNIPFVANFGMRVKLPVTHTFNIASRAQFRMTDDLFPNENFGQAVFSNENGITFAKKVNGVPASINDWYYFYCNKNKISRLQALEYYGKIVKLSRMPDSTYKDFARKVKLIDNTNPRLLDFSSPNNLMIDFKSQVITPVDITDTGYDSSKPLFRRMYNSLTDKDLRPLFLDKMNEEEIKECLSCQEIIGEKLYDAVDLIV